MRTNAREYFVASNRLGLRCSRGENGATKPRRKTSRSTTFESKNNKNKNHKNKSEHHEQARTRSVVLGSALGAASGHGAIRGCLLLLIRVHSRFLVPVSWPWPPEPEPADRPTTTGRRLTGSGNNKVDTNQTDGTNRTDAAPASSRRNAEGKEPESISAVWRVSRHTVRLAFDRFDSCSMMSGPTVGVERRRWSCLVTT